MAYEIPKVWTHGDIPTAADMNKYSDGENAMYASGAFKLHVPVTLSRFDLTILDTIWAIPAVTLVYTMVHRLRWLIYKGSGLMSFGSDSATLTDHGGTNTLDLETIGWLEYGMIYSITGVTWVVEDWNE